MSDFLMPSLGADMTAGTLLEWYVRPGDAVRRGDIVASVDTSKAEIEIEIFQDGTIGELLVDVGTRVPVGTPLATVNGAEPAVAAPPSQTPVAPVSPAPPPPAPVAPVSPAPPPPAPPAPAAPSAPLEPAAHRPRVSPLARRVAAELGVNLASVKGTGPDGAVTREDVERAAATTEPSAAAVPAPPPPTPEPAAGPAPAADRDAAMRRAIGDLMARSKREIPHYQLETTVDLSAALTWLAERNAELPPPERLLPAALLLAATARAVRAVPQLNGFFLDGAPQPAEHVHLGVALALRGGGLVAPAIHDADRLSPAELMAALRDLTSRARAGVLRGSEMSDPTITVTNLGERGADKVFGVIYPPQVALVGFGAIRERPWAAAGMVGARPLVAATLAGDHRASDGADGSRLLAELDRLLQAPEAL